MSQFKSELDGKIKGRLVTLHQDLVYESDLLKSTVIVPLGFTSDLASVPRGLWNIFPPWGPYVDAAVVHDFLYRTQVVKPRKLVDQVFLEAMEAMGCRWTQRYAIYFGVRIGGWLSWNHYEKMLSNWVFAGVGGVRPLQHGPDS